MNTLLKSLLLVPLVVVPAVTFAADHGNHDRGGDRAQHGNRDNDRGRDHSRNNDRGHSNVRVNIGIGAGARYGYYSPWSYPWSYGIGYSAFSDPYYLNRAYPYSSWGYSTRPVVIERNTYIEQPVGRVYTNRTNETSLLRDLNGHCFERSYDSNGNERRVELDASACDF